MAHPSSRQVKPHRTKEHYEQWLRFCLEAIENYIENGWMLPIGIKEFEYWSSDPIVRLAWQHLEPQNVARAQAFEQPSNAGKGTMRVATDPDFVPPRRPAHEEQISESYRQAYEDGDVKAIFEYAQDDRDALKADWVTDVLVKWRNEGNRKKKRFDKFMRAYWTHRGRRDDRNTVAIIKRDQEIYRAILHRDSTVPLKVTVLTLSEKHHVGVETIKNIRKHYATFTEPFGRILPSPPCFLAGCAGN
ncbi:MAG: hypothetical protein V3S24_08060 [Candidatus Tectomicrobia bacterium]